MFGDAGNDRLRGDAGNDKLNGGAGNDVMIGGGGQDAFIFNGGKDRVVDFPDDVDTLVLDDSLWVGKLSVREVVRSYAEVKGNDILFTFSGGNTLRVLGEDDKGDLLNDIDII
nr:hypothetical protein [Tropicimonas isoalkanivorans]